MYLGRYVLSFWLLLWSNVQTMAQMSCPQSAGNRCEPDESDDCKFKVDGYSFKFTKDGNNLKLTCNRNLTLDNSALPRFNKKSWNKKVSLNGCTPGQYTYFKALGVLNIHVNESLFIKGNHGVLTKKQLTGLNFLKELKIEYLNLTDDALQATPILQYLHFINMSPPSIKLLPNSLTYLELKNPGQVKLEKDDFTNLTKLTNLIIKEERFKVSVNGIEHVKTIFIKAQFVSIGPELSNTLEIVEIHGWGSEKPEPWLNCSRMKKLTILKTKAEKLPKGWIANCLSLRQLEVKNAPGLTSLHPDAFQGAINLEVLILTDSGLKELPSELLKHTTNLKKLDLQNNFLDTLNSDLTRLKLEELILSNNNFTYAVYKNISNSVRKLDLSHNKNFGVSSMYVSYNDGLPLEGKTSAKLHTDMSVIWRYWHRTLLNLTDLNLSYCQISQLSYEDFLFITNSSVTVNLTGNNIIHWTCSESEFSKLNKSHCRGNQTVAKPKVKIELDSTVEYDCKLAWTALALRKYSENINLARVKTSVNDTSESKLSEVSFERLACPAEPEYCPEKCNCTQILRDVDLCNGAPVRVINVNCTNLTELPKLKNDSNVAWNLTLASNRITTPRGQDLPMNVLEIDLRDNKITQVKDITSLTSPGRRLFLKGNKLDCTCDVAELISEPTLINDFGDLTCSDDGPLKPDCRKNTIITIILSLTPVLLIIIAVIICLIRPTSRSKLKKLLLGLGYLTPPPEPNEGRPYDVFLSFSHQDFEIVESIKSWLEDCRKPYRTLVHYRDWTPGCLIVEQIQASVRLSQRTVTVISQHFLESDWARAEFREAFVAALVEDEPRLIVILLEDPNNLRWGHDSASHNMLCEYVAKNTYLRWGDIWFWQKLRAALPAPRGLRENGSIVQPLMMELQELSPHTPNCEAE